MNLNVKTCAVIGNAPTILENKYGNDIDNHDVVIRCNRSFVDGFETYVGSKTTFRIVNCHTFFEFYNKSVPDFNKVFSTIETKTLNDIIRSDEIIILKDDMNCDEGIVAKNVYVEKLLKNEWGMSNEVYSINLSRVTQNTQLRFNASAGAVAIAFCLECFPNTIVNCYGFSFYQETKDCSHYYEEVAPKTLGHDYEIEKNILLSLDKVKFL